MSGDSAYASYIDASALVKIVADDADEQPGQAAIRRYFFREGVMYTTTFCIAECLSAFKRKLNPKKIINRSDYIRCVSEFRRLVLPKLRTEDVPLLLPATFDEALRLVDAYGIDFIDAMQVVTLLRGRFSGLVAGSKSRLITADRGLARIATQSGFTVWECTTEPAP